MKELTIENLKEFIEKEGREIAETVCFAQAFAQMERERVNEYKKPIFDRYSFSDEGDKTPITDPELLYKTNLESENYKKYNDEILNAHAANGWNGERGLCPALVAEDLQRQAEYCLISAWMQFAEWPEIHHLTLSSQLLNTLMRACIGGIDES